MTDFLIQGFQRYKQQKFPQNQADLQRLSKGQSPKVAILACCDSRIDPLTIFDASPGELFVIRNVANLMPPMELDGSYHGTSAAVEFAVTVLGVQDLIILGHADCGGIKCLVDTPVLAGNSSPPPERIFIHKWLTLATPIAKQFCHYTLDDKYLKAEQAAVALSLQNLQSYPWIVERMQNQQLRIHGWHYNFQEGILLALDLKSGSFQALIGSVL
jgi:carbonic anhydrase